MTMAILVAPSIRRFFFLLLFEAAAITIVNARPIVRNIQSSHEFDRLIQKHADETGLPVVIDFYSDSCGPCRMMTPIFKQIAAQYVDQAVFVKVDTNAQHQISSQYQIRSLPTFISIVNGKVSQTQVGGIGEGGLRQMSDAAIRSAQIDNTKLTLEELIKYYQSVDPSKSDADVQVVYQKCVEMNQPKTKKTATSSSSRHECVGAATNQLVRRLRQKYKQAPKTEPRFSVEEQKAKHDHSAGSKSKSGSYSSTTTEGTAGRDVQINLHLASLEQLREELQRRLDEERERVVENEEEDEDEADPDFQRWRQTDFPEKLLIVGGGPAGMAAALYGARAGLKPLVIAPSMGGQLLSKGVDVENYPGVHNSTGPGLVSNMRKQAAHFGALFEDDVAVSIDASSRPFRVSTNQTGVIQAHSIIICTGAEANWLGVKGEYEMRGGGVSSCATCDGSLFSGQEVVVVGGGDAAMEDALVLARTSRKVTVIHRRSTFRASKVLADRVLLHPSISVVWNTVLTEIQGTEVNQSIIDTSGVETEADVDMPPQKLVTGVVIENVETGKVSTIKCGAVFVAIGHTPATQFLEGVLDFDSSYPRYLWTNRNGPHYQTQTSVRGIFAAGDVADAVYRQAVTSAGSGAAAALDAERYVSENGLGNEEAELEAELLAELMADSKDSLANAGTYNAYTEAGGRIYGVKESVSNEL